VRSETTLSPEPSPEPLYCPDCSQVKSAFHEEGGGVLMVARDGDDKILGVVHCPICGRETKVDGSDLPVSP
jgi:hypothetical protein